MPWFTSIPTNSPAGGGRRKTGEEKLRIVAIPILAGIVEGQVPRMKYLAGLVGDKNTNNLSTLLAKGISGEGGAKLWRDRHGEIRRVQQNAGKAIELAAEADVKTFLEGRTLDKDGAIVLRTSDDQPPLTIKQLEAEVARLPIAS